MMMITETIQAKRARRAPTTTEKTVDPVATALRLSVPSWPLQNVVAVNPFWGRRDQNFSVVMEDLASTLRTKLYMPLDYYLEKYRAGAISIAALSMALEAAQSRMTSVPDSLDDLLRLSAIEKNTTRLCMTFAESCDQARGTSWQRIVTEQASKYAAAYFDDSQASARFPWQGLTFWRSWLAAQDLDRSMNVAGLKLWQNVLGPLQNLSARAAIDHILATMNLTETRRCRYLSRLLATGLGWSSQFQYCQWQRSLGYDETPNADPVDYLAVLAAYDYAFAKSFGAEGPSMLQTWHASLEADSPNEGVRHHAFHLHEIWQNAFELSYQTSIAAKIIRRPAPAKTPGAQLVFCIDVRSEIIRRALEKTSSEIATLGFAGFFGVPIDHQRTTEPYVSHRLPVLLSPAFKVEDVLSEKASERLRNKAACRSYIKNLRKAPQASFAYVELFGIYSIIEMLRQTLRGLFTRVSATSLPSRFDGQATLKAPDLGEQDKIERAATILRHLGLTSGFARLVVIAGHGSAATNNTFASALDCGACGGHAGDINARFAVGLMNDPSIRKGLQGRGIEIPAETWFVAALHETVTDRVHLLQSNLVPESHKSDIDSLQAALTSASDVARLERQTARSVYLDPSPDRRRSNWSEVRPEWGLAGNACFIVAPRATTKGAILSSRAFLHDYDATKDEGYATLELIMTAPMVVTNWINLQYYASTVAPNVFGAGDKTLHNIVDERGVQEGNGGDLRIGLPIQSVHDGHAFVHEPLRLSVFIAAPREALEMLIAKHAVVRELVDNQWLHLLHIEEITGTVALRLPGGLYHPLPADESSGTGVRQ